VRSEGTLTAILRGPTDNEINSNERVTLQSLMGKKKVVKKKKVKKPSTEVILGGV
jgi:hypothetical protein